MNFDLNIIIREIFAITNENSFENLALKIFKYQSLNNDIYKAYIDSLGLESEKIDGLNKIPFLPIEFFKNYKILSTLKEPVKVFESSRTSGSIPSKHYIIDLDLYEESLSACFSMFYEHPKNYCILALLPSYVEHKNSSLVYMAKCLIEQSNNPDGGFYLSNPDKLIEILTIQEKNNQKTLLLSLSFAIADLAENYKMKLKNTIIMETGGMKGRREEITREELHSLIKEKLGVKQVHSEYSMTELLSQTYSNGDGIFQNPPWMKILIRDIYDPFSFLSYKKAGGVNIIDLANIHSCSFIETQDIGILNPDNSFEILGRMDNSDIRGCNLLVY